MTIELVGFPQSNTMRAVMIAAAEKGVDFSVTVAMPHTPEIYAVNPLGKIPGMRHGDLTLGESTAICNYINENFDGPALMPNNPADRARAEQNLAIVTTGLDPLIIRNYVLEYMFNKDEDGTVERSLLERQIPKFAQHLKVIDEAIHTDGFIGSDHVTLVDCHAYPIMAAAEMFPESKEALTDCPSIGQWKARMDARESVKSTAPDA